MDAGPCSRSGRMGARGVVVIVTDNILTSSKVQSYVFVAAEEDALDALVVAVVREF